jgi:signal transduction histidine kinase/PAS domain-containing protein
MPPGEPPLRALFEVIWDRDALPNGQSPSGENRTTTIWTGGHGLLGYAPSEVGSTAAWWLERIHPDDRARVLATAEQAVASGRPAYSSEYRFRRRDGSWASLVTRAIVDRNPEGRALARGAILDLSDVPSAGDEASPAVGPSSRPVQSHRLLELVLDTIPVGVAVMDRDGNLVMNNPVVRRIWGDVIRPAGERYRESIGRWHSTGERVPTSAWGSQRALREGITSLDELIDIDPLDGGAPKIIRNSAAPIRDEHGGIVGAVVVNEEVTERVRDQEQLARRGRQQTALAHLSLLALGGDDVAALLGEATKVVARALSVDYAIVLEHVPEKQRLEFRAVAGPWAPQIDERASVRASPGSMAWHCLNSAAPVVFGNLEHECEPLLARGAEGGVAVAIAGKDRTYGLLVARTEHLREFAEDQIEFIWGVANVVATSIARARATAELRDKREELRTLSRKLIEAQEQERRAIARELHDDFGQVLTALRLSIQRRSSDASENLALVDGAIARMRDLAQDLRPPQLDALGLEACLRWYATREAERAGLSLTLAIEPLPTAPPAAVAITCFRVVQEALTNVIRHARARHVGIELRARGDQLELVVADDGGGFDVAEARHRAVRGESQGLLGMEERVSLLAGELRIDSAPGRGTTLRAHLLLAGGRG